MVVKCMAIRYMADNVLDIYPNSIRELHHLPNTSTIRQDTRISIVGYCRTRGIRSSSSIIISGDGSVVRLFRHRLP